MARLFYNLIFPFVFLFLLPGFLRRMIRRGNYRENFGQRLARFSEETKGRLLGEPEQTWIWVRAVSVGEMLIAEKFIRALREADPHAKIVLSTTTSTGYALARERFREATGADGWLELIYSPLDFHPMVQTTLRLIRPRLVVFVEAEIWPNLVALARKTGAKLALINARLSPRSEKRFLKFRRLIRGTFRQLDFIGVQEERAIGIWQKLGASRQTIFYTGSLKYDLAGDGSLEPAEKLAEMNNYLEGALGWNLQSDLILLGGSTHPGEETILARTYLQLSREFPGLRLILVPRHVERRAEIEADLHALGVDCQLRTSETVTYGVPILLLDTTGDLRTYYHAADIAFIGKSLTAEGGQNPIEALAAGCAVVFGPHMQNFRTITDQLVQRGGALQVNDEEELTASLRALLTQPEEAEALIQRGRLGLEPHQGATERTVRLVLNLDRDKN